MGFKNSALHIPGGKKNALDSHWQRKRYFEIAPRVIIHKFIHKLFMDSHPIYSSMPGSADITVHCKEGCRAGEAIISALLVGKGR